MALSVTQKWNPDGFRRLTRNEQGGIARKVKKTGRELSGEAKTALSNRWPGGAHPATGGDVIPFERSGDLRRSVHVTETFIDRDVITVAVVAPAVHDDYQYAKRLLERGYRFIPRARLRRG